MTFRRNRWRRATTCPSERSLSTTAMPFAVLLCAALPLQAQEQQQAAPTAQEGRRVHVVREGDTLWDLASFYLSDPFLWPEIYRINTTVVEDPHWIYPAEELFVPGPGEVLPERVVEGEEIRPRPQEVPLPEMAGRPSVFAAREMRRETLTYQPIEAVPATAVSSSDFYRSGMLAPLSELGPRGRIIDTTMPTGFTVRPLSTIPLFGRVYISHPDGEPPEPGDRMLLFRVERRVRPYGFVIRPTGLATIAAVHEDVSTAVIIEIYDRVQIGDQVKLAERHDERPGVFAEPVSNGPTGRTVALLDQQPVPSVEDFVFVDLGRNEGIMVGDEFELFVQSRRSGEGLRLPEEHVGYARVVRVTGETSTLRVLKVRHPTVDAGMPVRLVRRMPS